MIKLVDILKEYTPSDANSLNNAYREIKKLGPVNPLDPKEIVVDDSVFVEISVWDKRLWFSSLHSLDKGQGNATKVMQKIVDIADKYGVTIALDPIPYGKDPNKLTYNQLVKFYKKFGFKFEEGEEGFGDMERVAKQ
jgi:GNAT superfamily N-acetyltransferase